MASSCKRARENVDRVCYVNDHLCVSPLMDWIVSFTSPSLTPTAATTTTCSADAGHGGVTLTFTQRDRHQFTRTPSQSPHALH